jgi:hypothetical protein
MGSTFKPQDVEGWMDLLEAKEEGRRSLGDLIVINTMFVSTPPLTWWPRELVFFVLRPHDRTHISSLTVLCITACAFNDEQLAVSVESLHSLTTLVLGACFGACYVTDGYGPEGLSITSTSLTCLHLWSCTSSGRNQLQYTP